MPPWIQKYSPLALFFLCLVLAGGSAFLWLQRPGIIPVIEPVQSESVLPKNPFQREVEAYKKIGPPVLSLEYAPPKLELPDLRAILQFHGKNGRPDATSATPSYYFSFQGGTSNTSLASVKPLEKLYLAIQREGGSAKFTFSPKNQETPLWITIEAPSKSEGKASDIEVTLHMLDEKGESVTQPALNKTFKLTEREFPKSPHNAWEIGKWKVDATLLSRQRARWVGSDKFLEDHGGAEYADAAGKERIDFSEGEDSYSLFIAPKEIYIYKNDRWQKSEPGPESVDYSVLIVKKIDERLMTLELWDVQGKNKVTLNLLKATDNFSAAGHRQNFKFIGARTRSQFVFEIDDQKMIIRPGDWLLHTNEGWKKLTTAKEIDEYVDRKLSGTLFTFDKIIRKDDKQVMLGTLYSPNRTESEAIELSMQPGNIPQTREEEDKSDEDAAPPKEGIPLKKERSEQ